MEKSTVIDSAGWRLTQCVELLGTDVERIDIEALSLSFFQENIKRKKIRGGAYELLINYLYSSYIQCTRYSFVVKNAQHRAVMISTLFEVATAPLHCFQGVIWK